VEGAEYLKALRQLLENPAVLSGFVPRLPRKASKTTIADGRRRRKNEVITGDIRLIERN
jgi:hypothetical protein